ncbi:MAG: glycosyltransferase [Malacoplasma sp.]
MNNKEKNYISAVLYLHNNENKIAKFLCELCIQFENHFNQFEIIIVDDASSDNSIKKVKEVANNFSSISISIIHMGYFQGLESSMRAGVDLAIGDYVFEFDKIVNDYGEDMIFMVYQRALEGNDIVAACNNEALGSSKLFYKIFNHFGNYESKLQSDTFRIISRRGLNRIKSMNATIIYRKVLYASCGLNTSIIQYNGKKAQIEDDKEIQIRGRLAVDSILIFTDFGYKISLTITSIIMLILVSVSVYTIYIYLQREPVQGWVSTMLFLSFSFFGVFIILTIILKYLSLLLDLILKKKEYIISEIEKARN